MARFCVECGHELMMVPVEGAPRPKCPSCGWVLWEDPKLVAAVLVVNDGGAVLLGRRGPGAGEGRWSFPAGFVNRGERIEDAARREVLEETGLEVELGPLLLLRSERGSPVALAVYTARVTSGTPTPGDEMVELGWFEPGSVPELAFEHDAEVLRALWGRDGR